jgi:hypothetical protein
MKKKLFIFPIIIFALLIVHFVLAQEAGYELEVGIPGQVEPGTKTGLIDYVKYVFLYGLATIGLAALIALVIGGIMYMSSGSITKTDEAKKWIWGALTGLLLGLSAYLILNTINPDLVNLKAPHLPPADIPLSNTKCPSGLNYGECEPGKVVSYNKFNCIDKTGCYGRQDKSRTCDANGCWGDWIEKECIKTNSECKKSETCPITGGSKPECRANPPAGDLKIEGCTNSDNCQGTKRITRTCGTDGCWPEWPDLNDIECKINNPCAVETSGNKTCCSGIGSPTCYSSETECLTNCPNRFDNENNPGVCYTPPVTPTTSAPAP